MNVSALPPFRVILGFLAETFKVTAGDTEGCCFRFAEAHPCGLGVKLPVTQELVTSCR